MPKDAHQSSPITKAKSGSPPTADRGDTTITPGVRVPGTQHWHSAPCRAGNPGTAPEGAMQRGVPIRHRGRLFTLESGSRPLLYACAVCGSRLGSRAAAGQRRPGLPRAKPSHTLLTRSSHAPHTLLTRSSHAPHTLLTSSGGCVESRHWASGESAPCTIASACMSAAEEELIRRRIRRGSGRREEGTAAHALRQREGSAARIGR